MDKQTTGIRLLWLALLVAYPFHWYLDFGLGRFNMSLGDGVILVIGILWLIGIFGRRTVPVYIVPLTAFLAVSMLSIWFAWMSGVGYLNMAGYVAEVLNYAGAFAWLVGVYIFVRALPRQAVQHGLLLSVSVASVLSIIAIYESLFGGVARPTGLFRNPNIFANYLVMNLAVFFYLGKYIRTFRGGGLAALTVPLALMFGVVNTGSRGGLIALSSLLLLVGLISVYYRSVRPRQLLMFASVGIGALVVVWHLNPWLFTNRILSERNIDVRLELWLNGIDAFLASPVIGIGLGQLRWYFEHSIDVNISAHNSVVSIGAEAGIVGLALLAFVFLLVVRDVLAAKDRRLLYLFAFVVAAIAQGASATNVESFRSIWLVLGLLAAFTASSISAKQIGRLLREVPPNVWPRQ